MLPSGNLDWIMGPEVPALVAHAELESMETRLDVVVALGALRNQVVIQANYHDDPWEVVHLEARTRWLELILKIPVSVVKEGK
jgi:hypothetical protein